jgi:hypothetical protein
MGQALPTSNACVRPLLIGIIGWDPFPITREHQTTNDDDPSHTNTITTGSRSIARLLRGDRPC